MKLIVISRENFFEKEAQWINELMRGCNGEFTLHLRKPFATEYEMEGLLNQIDAVFFDRVVLHDHFPLACKYHLKGIHLNSRNPIVSNTGRYWEICSISRSCHSLQEVQKHKERCNYVTLSPIFNSISKQGYHSAFAEHDLTQAAERGIVDEKVVAMGGITSNNIAYIADLGFGGAAVLGAIWNHKDIQHAQRELNNLLKIIR